MKILVKTNASFVLIWILAWLMKRVVIWWCVNNAIEDIAPVKQQIMSDVQFVDNLENFINMLNPSFNDHDILNLIFNSLNYCQLIISYNEHMLFGFERERKISFLKPCHQSQFILVLHYSDVYERVSDSNCFGPI